MGCKRDSQGIEERQEERSEKIKSFLRGGNIQTVNMSNIVPYGTFSAPALVDSSVLCATGSLPDVAAQGNFVDNMLGLTEYNC